MIEPQGTNCTSGSPRQLSRPLSIKTYHTNKGNEPPAEAYILAVFKTLDTENEDKISWDQFQKWYLTSDMFKEKMHQAEEAAEEDEPGVSLDFPDG